MHLTAELSTETHVTKVHSPKRIRRHGRTNLLASHPNNRKPQLQMDGGLEQFDEAFFRALEMRESSHEINHNYSTTMRSGLAAHSVLCAKDSKMVY